MTFTLSVSYVSTDMVVAVAVAVAVANWRCFSDICCSVCLGLCQYEPVHGNSVLVLLSS